MVQRARSHGYRVASLATGPLRSSGSANARYDDERGARRILTCHPGREASREPSRSERMAGMDGPVVEATPGHDSKM